MDGWVQQQHSKPVPRSSMEDKSACKDCLAGDKTRGIEPVMVNLDPIMFREPCPRYRLDVASCIPVPCREHPSQDPPRVEGFVMVSVTLNREDPVPMRDKMPPKDT